jgi:CubicO group peptidase (beta-lactamase class C family)
MKRYHVPGVAIGMLRADDVDVVAYGVTSVEHPLPVDGDTLFQIASVTKTMTATVVMRLVERRALDLDAPVRRYIPTFRLRDSAAQERATVRHLVTHSGGWLGDCFADFGSGGDALERYVAAMAELEQITPLGEVWHYSNSSFALLGRLIEVVTGESYEDATRELLFRPLGMTRSCFSAAEAITHRVAIGHVIVDEEPRVARPWAFPRATTPVGGVASTANDLMRYARFHLGDGTTPDGARLLSRESLELMRTPLADADLDRKVGVSWFIRTVGGVRLQYHGGVAIGQQGVLMLAPERGEAVTVQTNSARGGLLHQDVATWWLRQRLSLKVPEPAYVELERARYTEYADRYVAELSDAELVLSDTGLVYQAFSHNRLGVQPTPPDPPPSRVAFTSDARFTLLDGPLKDTRGEFLRGSDGRVRFLRVGGRVYRGTRS